MSVNKVILLGRVGQDPQFKYLPDGKAVVNLSLATSESWKDKDGNKQEKTEWHRLVSYGKSAEILNQYVAKGNELYIEGRLHTRMWEKDGHKNYTTEIIIEVFNFIGGKRKEGGEAGAGQGAKNNSQDNSSPADISNDAHFAADDIPF